MTGRVFQGFLLAGGLCGAAGVMVAARAAHSGGAFTGTVSNMLMFHAPLFVALRLAGAERLGRLLTLAGLVMLAGLLLFCADLYVRDFGMARLFPMAAPIGGSALILGWIGVALSAVFRR